MATDLTNELHTVTETCHYPKDSPRTLYRDIQDHRLPGYKPDTEWRFTRTDFEQWLREQPGSIPHP